MSRSWSSDPPSERIPNRPIYLWSSMEFPGGLIIRCDATRYFGVMIVEET